MHSAAMQAALAYADVGLRVFPVWGVRQDGTCECSDASCKSPGKHPHGRLAPRGLNDASGNPELIQAWWRQAPTAGVAIVTGELAYVIDCDGEEGIEAWRELCADRGEWSSCAVNTGGGGRHYYFAVDDAYEVRNQQGMLVDGQRLDHVDVRGVGGYVVAPPSRHASGKSYEWWIPIDKLGPAPPWLAQILAGGASHPMPAPPAASSSPPATASTDVPDHVVEMVRSALAVIPPNEDRTSWVEMVSMPLHDLFRGSDAGYEVWHEWCRRGQGLLTPNGNPAYGGEAECRRVWRSFSTAHRSPKGIATLWAHARARGWRLAAAAPPPGDNGAPAPAVPLPGEESAPTAWTEPESPRRAAGAAPTLDHDRAWIPDLHWLRDLVRSIGRLLQVPAEFPAMLSLAMASGAYGRALQLQLAGTGWIEYPPMWVICAFASGAGKSPVFRPLVAPFREWDAQADGTGEEDAWESRRDEAQIMLATAQHALRRQASKASGEPELARRLREDLKRARRTLGEAERTRPQSRRLLASSMTTPALVEFLMRHRERCLIVDPEGSIFQHVLAGASDAEKDLDPWLKAFSADSIQQNRIGDRHRTPERFVAAPNLSMALCTQTAALSLFRDEYAEGKGFLARFLPCLFERDLPERALVDGEVPAHLRARWRDACWRLLSMPVPDGEPPTVVLDGRGAEEFRSWMQGWLDAARADPEADASRVVSYDSPPAAKLRSYALRLVLLFHALTAPDPAGTAVDPDTVRTVCRHWMPFLRASVERVVGLVRDDPDLSIAERVLGWIDRAGAEHFSRAECYRNLKSRGGSVAAVRRVNDLNGGLGALCDAGWIQPIDKPRLRGPGAVAAASKYAVHPEFAAHYARLLGGAG